MNSPKPGASPGLGVRLRKIRTERRMSLRELGQRAGCSASLISQVERGQSAPSAGVLYALANELQISLDYLFGVSDAEGAPAPVPTPIPEAPSISWGEYTPATQIAHSPAPASHAPVPPPPGHAAEGSLLTEAPQGAPITGPALAPAVPTILQRGSTRRTIDLASGVRWERLTPQADGRVDFLEVVYAPFGRSTESRTLIRHEGREYLLVLEGRLHADIGFETYVLEPGDSLAFDPSAPHQYRNMTDQPVRVVSVVIHRAD
ncbi:Helix-turn-helix [Sinosporangium album]|uniref:Helix-turn-helix n=1 Tax=Sinosporangium album TaxID=504805 RepID=A0A1G8JIU1_9ACTN|nr:XRE family transcriptional regulator [Sinosporangium album]SDI31011.1 Helix-turn-helix [Sinosporangium album]